MPKSLTTPQDRAAFVVLHFWDAMDFGDTLRSHNEAFMEQNFVNFLSLFPHAETDALPPGIDALMQRAAADTKSLSIINELAEVYLDDPDSPMRNEDFYILFLESMLRLPSLCDAERERPAYLLEMARKNRPGTRATDFKYTDRKGKSRTLHGTKVGKDARLLLLFYDPDCQHCQETLSTLSESQTINQLIASGKLAVLAIYTEGDRPLWEKTKGSMPSEWTVGYDDSNIAENGEYNLPSMPILYLLDKDKKVLLKETTLEGITNY